MAISDLILLRDSVDLDTEAGVVSIPVYGLGADAIAFLAQSHGTTLGSIYKAAVAGDLTLDNIEPVLATLLDEAPIVVATVIAFGAREPGAIEHVAGWPLGTQMEAVEKIVKLTFAGERAPKKAAEIVTRLLGAINGMMSQPPSPSGSGESVSS